MPASARRPLLLVAIVLAVAALLLGAPSPAAAHTALESTDPVADSSLASAPAAVTLTFGGRVIGADVTVTGPDGARATTGPVAVEGSVVRVPIDGTAPGRYDVEWRATAADGHPLQGTFGFEHAPPVSPEQTAAPSSAAGSSATPSAAPSPAGGTTPGTPVGTRNDVIETASDDDGGDGTPGWVLPVLAAAAVAVGAGLLLRRRRG